MNDSDDRIIEMMNVMEIKLKAIAETLQEQIDALNKRLKDFEDVRDEIDSESYEAIGAGEVPW